MKKGDVITALIELGRFRKMRRRFAVRFAESMKQPSAAQKFLDYDTEIDNELALVTKAIQATLKKSAIRKRLIQGSLHTCPICGQYHRCGRLKENCHHGCQTNPERESGE